MTEAASRRRAGEPPAADAAGALVRRDQAIFAQSGDGRQPRRSWRLGRIAAGAAGAAAGARAEHLGCLAAATRRRPSSARAPAGDRERRIYPLATAAARAKGAAGRNVRGLGRSLERAFRAFDANGDGDIDDEFASELVSLGAADITEAQLDELIRVLDTDGSGQVDYTEFARWLGQPTAAAPPPEVRAREEARQVRASLIAEHIEKR